ncbi:glutamate mutase L [Crossiella cryophila]|uniref:Uncharacterized protein (TIGR01319 family) n=1 Tax=Crossiella cryophila TaxID=43355 RepID=A0A7W7C7C9_9PSEU|nr:glutamate mutase L [Crossiella cryophila]MBB4675836.1 uncharacterized protein (TIGR01319 family) [Crossiella cryophila]
MTILCLDVGSTWTKAALLGPDGTLLGTAQHPTTPPEVLTGINAVTAALDAAEAEVLACSSAGGGLRLAVVGQERLVSAEAAYRVALSAGAKIVHVAAGELDGAGIRALRASAPDVLLLVGGTDGGETRVLAHNVARVAANRLRAPVVLAGNQDVRAAATETLRAAGRTVIATDNVLPDVGELAPGPARAAIREMFLTHVIGGKGLSRGPRFRRLVRAVTPDAVLRGVAELASVLAEAESPGAVLVVDVGGATTDVYSAVSTVDELAGRSTVELPPDRRTVEGDLGMRWSAPGVLAEATAERLVEPAEAAELAPKVQFRAGAVDWVPTEAGDIAVDGRIAELAAVIAVRRHLRLVAGRLGPQGIGLLVLSGGVFRHAGPERVAATVATLRADPVLRPVLRNARAVVDQSYVLAPAGLLTDAGHTAAARTLLTSTLT